MILDLLIQVGCVATSVTRWDTLRKTASKVEREEFVKAQQVVAAPSQPSPREEEGEDPLAFLYSSSDEDVIRQVRVRDTGSLTQRVKLFIQVYGILDSGADITIIGGKLFKKVAMAARLKKKDFMKPDKMHRTYDQKAFRLDGRMDLDITFEDRTMHTPVYVKIDAHDQLLLSEGVCRQLEIFSYHSKVEK